MHTEMRQLFTGEFYGQTNQTRQFDGITITDTEYQLEYVDWHYHENAYFTFILQGNLIEGNKTETYHCGPGTLLFHNWQEPHYNIKPEGFSRGFQVEVSKQWIDSFEINLFNTQGSQQITRTDIKLLFYQLFSLSKTDNKLTSLLIQCNLLQSFATLANCNEDPLSNYPEWIHRIKEYLYFEQVEKLTLDNLAKEANVHPVHLSRSFPKYFNCSLSEYIRKIRIEKSFQLLLNSNMRLTDISYACGFSDQSHFSRCFKTAGGMSPKAFRNLAHQYISKG